MGFGFLVQGAERFTGFKVWVFVVGSSVISRFQAPTKAILKVTNDRICGHPRSEALCVYSIPVQKHLVSASGDMPSQLSDRSDDGSVGNEAVQSRAQANRDTSDNLLAVPDETGLPQGLKFRTELIAFLKRIEKFSQNWARWTVTKARRATQLGSLWLEGSKERMRI